MNGFSGPCPDLIRAMVCSKCHALYIISFIELCLADMPLYSVRWCQYSAGIPFNNLHLKEYGSGYWANYPTHIKSSQWKAIMPSLHKNCICKYHYMAC